MHASVSASRRARRGVGRATGRPFDEEADDRRHEQERDESDGVAFVGDRERVDGIREEPVEEQEGAHRAEKGDPRPADRPDGHDGEQVAEPDAGEADAIPERIEHERQHGQPDEGAGEPPELAATAQAGQ